MGQGRMQVVGGLGEVEFSGGFRGGPVGKLCLVTQLWLPVTYLFI